MALALLKLSSLIAPAVPTRPFPPSDAPLNLELDWRLEGPRHAWLKVIGGSLAVHVLLFLGAIRLPSFVTPSEPVRRAVVRHIPLYLPPELMTQKAPNRDRVSKQIDLASLLAERAQQQAQPASPAPSRKRFELPKRTTTQPAKSQTPLPTAPEIALNQPPGPLPPGAANGLPVAAPPPPSPTPGPFQNIGADTPRVAHPSLTPPKATVESAIHELAQSGASNNVVITDDSPTEPLAPSPGTLRQPGAQHAAIELQSDPQGADFKPYLTRILAIVRANWRHVIPESARMGTLRGRTVLEFVVDREGRIPKLVTAQSSGIDPLDRAAIAGLSMSNPLPPLPPDFKGAQIRLAFSFAYNMPAQ
jgi:TonB family protein